MEHGKYNNLEEYIRQSEPHAKVRGWAWQTAIGLQKVDGLSTSEYLLDTARQHIDGEITIEEAQKLIDTYYKSRGARTIQEDDRTEEADKVAARITELIQEESFSFTPGQITSIHRRLFDGIYKFAGKIRDYNITKKEWVLNGNTVYYSSCDAIVDNINYDLANERNFSYAGLSINQAIEHIARFCSNIWQIHAFGEGNTRTIAVFMIKYLKTLGFSVGNTAFAQDSWYFRNALVRANYSNLKQGITENLTFLERFFRNMLLNEQNELRNRELHIDWRGEQSASSTQTQSATSLPPKCKNCTLEELAVVRIILSDPKATQKQMSAQIGKSERTVKTITLNLSEKGIIRRINGKRNGYWEVIWE